MSHGFWVVETQGEFRGLDMNEIRSDVLRGEMQGCE
jgi:hypothetical protein